MRLNSIQALRGIAAYLVLFYHIQAAELIASAEAGNPPESLLGIFRNGFAGVDLFFVISGFIMVYVTHDRPGGLSTVKEFMLARVFRIYPPWWLFAGLFAAYMIYQYGMPGDPKTLKAQDLGPIEYFVKSMLLMPLPATPILGVGWTLIHEMYFYIAFALILLTPARTRFAWVGVWGLLVISGAILGLSASHAYNLPTLIFAPLTLEFILGAFAAYVYMAGYRLMPWVFLLAGSALLVIDMAIQPYPNPFTLEWGRVLLFALPCTFIVYGAACLAHHFKGPVAGIMTHLGNWSFSLYLSHVFVLAGYQRVVPFIARELNLPAPIQAALTPGSVGIIDNLIMIITVSLGSTLLAAVTYHLFEQPTLRFLNSRFRKRQPDKDKAHLSETVAP